MPKRRLTGIGAPLVEDERDSLSAVYIFADIVTRDDVKQFGDELESQAQSIGLIVSKVQVNPIDPQIVVLDINRDNLSYDEITNLRQIGTNKMGFKEFRLTTVDDINEVFVPEI